MNMQANSKLKLRNFEYAAKSEKNLTKGGECLN